jgi:hypothetical protein
MPWPPLGAYTLLASMASAAIRTTMRAESAMARACGACAGRTGWARAASEWNCKQQAQGLAGGCAFLVASASRRARTKGRSRLSKGAAWYGTVSRSVMKLIIAAATHAPGCSLRPATAAFWQRTSQRSSRRTHHPVRPVR